MAALPRLRVFVIFIRASKMISYLLNALSSAASTATALPGKLVTVDQSHHSGDESPRGVEDMKDQTGNNGAADGHPTPSKDDGMTTVSPREMTTMTNNNNKTDDTTMMKKSGSEDDNLSLEIMAVTPDEGKQPFATVAEADEADAGATENVERTDTDKMEAEDDTITTTTTTSSSGVVVTEKRETGNGPSKIEGGKKKRKRGGTESIVLATTAGTTKPSSSFVNNNPVQNNGSGNDGEMPAILPETIGLSTQLQLHAALMSTRSAIRRAYTHSHLGGIILISRSRCATFTNAGIVTSRRNNATKRGSNDDMIGHCILAIRYCGLKEGRSGTVEIEYARTSALGRAERFLGCCTGTVNNCGGDESVFGTLSPRWEKYMLPPRVMTAYLGLLDNTCAYQGHSCMESGAKVYEGFLP